MKRLTIFRMEQNNNWLHKQILEGNLRMGWGPSGCGLVTENRRQVEKHEWVTNYKEAWNHYPSPKRFAILSYMLELSIDDIVVVPKMPKWNEFTIARVNGKYRFEFDHVDRPNDDFRHIVSIDPKSVRTFNYHADEDAFLISGLFARACHMPAISFCYNTTHIEASHKLLDQPKDNLNSKPQEELTGIAVNNAIKYAAEKLWKEVKNWNGGRFEQAIRQAFQDQGYTMLEHTHYDGKGADADIVVSPPANPFEIFLPSEIAVQVKWKQGVDRDDENAIDQIIKWADSQESSVKKCVISSADKFTDDAKILATENGVKLICGLETMCFLLGVPNLYREDWDK